MISSSFYGIKLLSLIVSHATKGSLKASHPTKYRSTDALDGRQVATQLGLLDDAVRLYRECGRYDLLNRLYQV